MTNKLSLKTQTGRSTQWHQEKFNCLNVFAGKTEVEVRCTKWGKSDNLDEYFFSIEIHGKEFKFNSENELLNQLNK